MGRILKFSLAGATLLATAATPALAVDPVSPMSVAADIFLARPASFLGTVAGTGFWIVTSPITFLNGNASDTYDLLVQTPADYTFKRPLGEDL
jgi:hypothetical protein